MILDTIKSITDNGLFMCQLIGGAIITFIFFCFAGWRNLIAPINKVRLILLFIYNSFLIFIIIFLTYMSVIDAFRLAAILFLPISFVGLAMSCIFWFKIGQSLRSERWMIHVKCFKIFLFYSVFCGILNFFALESTSPSYMGGMLQLGATNICIGFFVSAIIIGIILLFLRKSYIKENKLI